MDRGAVAHVAGLRAEARRRSRSRSSSRGRRPAPSRSAGRRRRCRSGPRRPRRRPGTSRSAGRSRCRSREATIPIAIMRATGCFSPSIRGSFSGGPSVVPAAGSLSLTARDVIGSRGERLSAARSGGERAAPLPRSPTAGVRGGGGRPSRTAPAGGSRPPGPPLRPGCRPEQQLGGARHAHPLQLALGSWCRARRRRAGAGGARWRSCARREASERSSSRVLALDHGEGVLVQLAASVHGRLAHHDVIRARGANGWLGVADVR